MSVEKTYSVNDYLKRFLSLLTSSCIVLSIAIYTFEKQVSVFIRPIVDAYVTVRELVLLGLRLDVVLEYLALFFGWSITLVPPWQDILVILLFYTIVQMIDSMNGALNYKWAMLWRFFAGSAGILASVVVLSYLSGATFLSTVELIALSVTSGLLVFRALHPFQIAFDVGWKELKALDSTRPQGFLDRLVFFGQIALTRSARSMFFKKLKTVLKLSLWIVALSIVRLLFRLLFPNDIGPNTDFLFLVIFMLTICLFHLLMEPLKNIDGVKNFSIPILGSSQKKIYFSKESGNYRIATDIRLTMYTALAAVYGGNAITHAYVWLTS